jgi:hypothetical protein
MSIGCKYLVKTTCRSAQNGSSPVRPLSERVSRPPTAKVPAILGGLSFRRMGRPRRVPRSANTGQWLVGHLTGSAEDFLTLRKT